MAVACTLGLFILLAGLSEECTDGLLWIGIVGAVLVGLILFCYPRWWVIVACGLCVLLAIGLLLPASGASREVPKERWSCYVRASSIQLHYITMSESMVPSRQRISPMPTANPCTVGEC